MGPDNESDLGWLDGPCRKHDDYDAPDELVRCNLALLKDFAVAYAKRGETIDDLQRVALLALMRPFGRSET